MAEFLRLTTHLKVKVRLETEDKGVLGNLMTSLNNGLVTGNFKGYIMLDRVFCCFHMSSCLTELLVFRSKLGQRDTL